MFAPSSPFQNERFDAGLARLEAAGFEVVVHPQARARQGYLAGSDDTRLAALHALVDDPQIDGIIAARGGYGAHRYVARLDFARIRQSRKALIGFSDVTALHSAIQARAALTSIHGPVVTQLGDLPEADLAGLTALLENPAARFELVSVDEPLVGGRATGILTGGCLSVLAPLIGTDLLFVPDGAILLLEDVGEATYRIDRLLTQLRLGHVLDRVAGVVLGDFTRCEPQRPGEQTLRDVLSDRLGDLGVPVLSGLPIGHGARNHAVLLGAEVTLDATGRRLLVGGASR